jgi:hypothetical protein
MTKRNAKTPTAPTSEQLSAELNALADRMCVASHHIRCYGGMAAEPQIRALELSRAADMVYAWAREVEKEGKK